MRILKDSESGNYWDELRAIAIDLYPQGIAEQGVWTRSGGKLSDVNTSAPGKTQWGNAIALIENGGTVTPLKLLKEMSDDFQNNDRIKLLIEVTEKQNQNQNLKAINPPHLLLHNILKPESEFTFPQTIQLRSLSKEQQFELFDLGSIWGLDRSSFIGIAGGWKDSIIYEELCNIESLLYDQTRLNDDLPNLTPRLWFWLDFHNLSLTSEKLINKYFSHKAELKSAFLKSTESFKDVVDLGIFFEIDLDNTANNYDCDANAIAKHCNQILDRENSRFNQIAIILYLKSNNRPKRQDMASKLMTRIRQLKPQIRVESMEVVEKQEIPIVSETPISLADLTADSLPLGSYLAPWVEKSLLFGCLTDAEYKTYSKLREKFKNISLNNIDLKKMGPASKVIQDLDLIVSEIETDVDRQFLLLVQNYLPDKLFELIKAYGKSCRQLALRESLLFASELESLLDAWLEGSISRLFEHGVSNEFDSSPNGPIIDSVVLAILKRFRSGQQEHIKDIINKLEPSLSETVKKLANICLSEEMAGNYEVFKKFEVTLFMFALKAGINVRSFLLEAKELEDLNLNSSFWQMFSRITPDTHIISRLLGLCICKRAILGLCTSNDLQKIDSDIFLKNQVYSSRRDRLLTFLP
jgi:hypothetical protein